CGAEDEKGLPRLDQCAIRDSDPIDARTIQQGPVAGLEIFEHPLAQHARDAQMLAGDAYVGGVDPEGGLLGADRERRPTADRHFVGAAEADPRGALERAVAPQRDEQVGSVASPRFGDVVSGLGPGARAIHGASLPESAANSLPPAVHAVRQAAPAERPGATRPPRRARPSRPPARVA